MKPPLFEYYAARTIDDVVEKLSGDEQAMILAGGQSIIPAMNFRLVSPDVLVDISRVSNLCKIEVSPNGIDVYANVRHRDLELNEKVFLVNPLIRKALECVAHVPIRHRGTTVGSICHADAAAEMPMILLLTGGKVIARSRLGEREILADEFFIFHMTTALQPGEMVVNVHFPALPAGARCAFAEFARRRGDYALAAVGAIVKQNANGVIEAVRLAACGVSSKPVRLTAAERLLEGRLPDQAVLAEVAEAAAEVVTVPDDALASRAYRQHLLSGLTRQVIEEATLA